MPGTIKRLGPSALSNTLTTNVYNNTSALIYDVIKSITLVNKTAGAVTVTLYIGATGANAAGTEILVGHSVPANSEYTFYPNVKMTSTDFLVGGASAATSITFYATTEQTVV